MEARRPGVSSQALWLLTSSGFAQLISAAMYALAARAAGPAEFGAIVSILALALTAATLFDFGTNLFWVRELANGTLSTRAVSARATGKLMIGGLVAGSVWPIVLVTTGTDWWIAAPFGFAVVVSQLALVPLRGLALGHRVALVTIVDRSVAAVVFSILLAAGAGGPDALWISLLCGLIAGAVFAYGVTPGGARLTAIPPLIPWAGAGSFGATSAAVGLQSLDVPILAAVSGVDASGVYGAVNRWTQPMGLLSTAFVNAALPFMSRAKGAHAAFHTIRRSLWLIGAAMAACVLVILIAEPVVMFVLGPQYSSAVAVLRLLAVSTLIAVVNQPAIAFLQARRLERAAATIVGSSVAVQLILVAVLGSRYGAEGAAVALIAAQSMILAAILCFGIVTTRRGRSE